MAVVGYATVQLIPSLQGFGPSVRGQMTPVIRQVGTESGKTAGGLFGGSFLGSVGRIMSAAGIYELGSRVATGISDAISTGIKGFADLQTYTISFKTLLGSAGAANDMIRDLYAFAAKTPFDVEGSVVGAQKLLGVNVAAKDVIPTLTTLGDATAALGGSTSDFNSVLLAYSQIMARGKVSTQDLYQISNTGIPIFQLMSKALGKPVGEIQKLIETGNLASDDVLPKLLAQMNEDYGGAMSGQAETLNGLWSTFKDTMSQTLTTALTPIGEWLVSVLPGATTAATDAIGWLQEKFTAIGDWIADPSNKIGDTFQPLIDGIQNTDWDGLLEGVGTAFSGLWTIVQPIVSGISDLLGSNLPLAAQTLSELLTTLFTPIKEDAPAVSGNLDDVSQKMGAAGQSAADAKQSWWDTASGLGLVGQGGVQTTLQMFRVANALLQGKNAAQVADAMLSGQFGPGLQKQGQIAFATGLALRAAFEQMKQAVVSFVTQSVARIAAWAGQFVSRITQGLVSAVAAMAAGGARMTAGLVGGLAGLVTTVNSKIQEVVSGIKGFLGSFRDAGASLIGGFVNGIKSKIESAKSAASNIVSAVANFFPHSPAPEGPFSGRGWTLYSGRSLMDGFAQGIGQRTNKVQSLLANSLTAPALAGIGGPSASVVGEVTAATTSRSGAYIGTVNLPTATNGNTGIIDELNFYLRNLARGGR